MKVKLSKKQWEFIGSKAGWSKKAQLSVDYDELTLGSTPCSERCAQVGATLYYDLAKMEISAYAKQIERMFPNMPEGCFLKRSSNPHDFGTYYELAIKFDSNDEEAVKFAYELEDNTPEYWDEAAKAELTGKGYFEMLNANSIPD
jgi:hypothetical protein